jgi:hypothetical protein
MSDLGENGVTFWISRDGTVTERPEARIQSTSAEMQHVIEKIVPAVADYMESLIRKYREEFKELES